MGVFRDQIAAVVVKCPHAIESATGCCYVEGSQAYKRIDRYYVVVVVVVVAGSPVSHPCSTVGVNSRVGVFFCP